MTIRNVGKLQLTTPGDREILMTRVSGTERTFTDTGGFPACFSVSSEASSSTIVPETPERWKESSTPGRSFGSVGAGSRTMLAWLS